MATDILVTHIPPVISLGPSQPVCRLTSSPPSPTQFGHLDLDLGCPGLLREVWRVKPRLHVFGHVHWGHVNRPLNEASFEALQRDNGLIDMTVDIHATGRFLR